MSSESSYNLQSEKRAAKKKTPHCINLVDDVRCPLGGELLRLADARA